MSLFLIFGSHSFLILVRRNFSIFGICFSKPISLALSNIPESIPERGIIGIKPDSKTYVFNFLIIVEGKIKGEYQKNEFNAEKIASVSAGIV